MEEAELFHKIMDYIEAVGKPIGDDIVLTKEDVQNLSKFIYELDK